MGVNRVSKDPLDNTTYYYRYESSTDETMYILGAQTETQCGSLYADIDKTLFSIINCGTGDHTADNVYCITP